MAAVDDMEFPASWVKANDNAEQRSSQLAVTQVFPNHWGGHTLDSDDEEEDKHVLNHAGKDRSENRKSGREDKVSSGKPMLETAEMKSDDNRKELVIRNTTEWSMDNIGKFVNESSSNLSDVRAMFVEDVKGTQQRFSVQDYYDYGPWNSDVSSMEFPLNFVIEMRSKTKVQVSR